MQRTRSSRTSVDRWLCRFTRNVSGSQVKNRRINLVRIASKRLLSIILYRSSSTRERCMRETEGSFCPGRGVLTELSLCNRPWNIDTFHRPTIAAFLGSKGMLDSVDRTVLSSFSSLNGVLSKWIPPIQSLYANNRSWVRVYGDVSSEFIKRIDLRHVCCFHLSFQFCHWYDCEDNPMLIVNDIILTI